MKTEIIVVGDPAERAEELPSQEDPSEPKVGRWYNVTFTDTNLEDDEEVKRVEFGCIVHLGSNYARFKFVGGLSYRVHLDEFFDICEHVPDPDAVIDAEVTRHQTKTKHLMQQVKEITARLAITPGVSLPGHVDPGAEVRALSLHGKGRDMNDYKGDLIRAKDESLPKLFEEIKESNRNLGLWLEARIIPLEAQVEMLNPLVESIKGRIYNVELYAGLVEQVTQVRDGDPAGASDKIHLFQRRHYMDEECLAQYETGGMSFENIEDFDNWLSRPDNFERILPFPKCIVAFRVRRHQKEYRLETYQDFIEFQFKTDADNLTYMYIRNGERLFRLATSYEFDAKLFPDMDRQKLDAGKLWAKMSGSRVEKLITDDEYQGLLESELEEERKYEAAPDNEKWRYRNYWHESKNYVKFSPGSVFFDDISSHIRHQLEKHNRLVLILQGLLDRSPVLHPHPAWTLWHHAAFEQALELIYDEDRALGTGDKPDFEAYRARLNASIEVGCVTIGQQEAWITHETAKENHRRACDHRYRSDRVLTRYVPYGNSGPGKLARVERHSAKTKSCSFSWTRKRQTNTYDDDKPENLRCTFTASTDDLLNVTAYKPGDFRQFFADPRTRSEYLEWAPLLLEAEEYHAGNRKVSEPVSPTKREPNPEASRQYHARKRRKALVGKAVRLTRDITLRSEKVYREGSLWRVYENQGSEFKVVGITEDGRRIVGEDDTPYIIGLAEYDFQVDPSIPPAPKKSGEE